MVTGASRCTLAIKRKYQFLIEVMRCGPTETRYYDVDVRVTVGSGHELEFSLEVMMKRKVVI